MHCLSLSECYSEFSNNLLPPDEKTSVEKAPSVRPEKAGEVTEGGEKSKNKLSW